MKVDALLGQVLQHTRPPGLRLASRIHGLCAADLIHGTEIVYSEDSERNRLRPSFEPEPCKKSVPWVY
jgi:hypothetical protein